VLAGARPETELGQVVAQCGRIVPPEDATAFAAALQALAADAPMRRTLGERARRFAEEHVARDAVLARFERDLLDCIARPPR
jgi:colanic acid biosynthesis glycosyl transferase WcaI